VKILETDQEKLVLYANAQAYAKANDIQLGQALTQQQIGELTQPMLWYVEQTVPEPGCTATGTLSCPTVTALMPQVYLPANTSSLSADGNIVASDSLQLNFGNKQTGGSILNTGTIASGGSLTVTTGTLTNQANQVDVGEIWQNVNRGYLETTGTTVQPGGFMSAAAGQMTLNVSQLNQIGGLLQEVNPDGSANNAATQQLLAQVLQQLGGNFTQTAVSDDLHTHFVAAGGFGITQLAAMVAAIAASFLTAGGATMALGGIRPRIPVIEQTSLMADDSPIAMTGGYPCRKRRSCRGMRRV
jgi:filamentous hemagglutinin